MAVIAPPALQAGTQLFRFFGLVNISGSPPLFMNPAPANNPYTHQRIYEGNPINSITTSLLYVRALATGQIKTNAIHLPFPITGTYALFQIKKNGVNVFPELGGPAIDTNESFVITEGLSIEVEKGDAISLDVDRPGTSGLPAPLVWTFEIE